MSRYKQLLQKILGGRSDANIRFGDLRGLLWNLGFIERVQGSHQMALRRGSTYNAMTAMRSPIRYSRSVK